ncbi:MAG: outer membrane beta-barrel protein, partial [Planctomycetota bacterium]
RDEIRSEIMQEEVRSTVAECLAGDGCGGILGGLFKGTTVTGFLDVNFIYNLRNAGENATNRNANGKVNFIGENDDNTFGLQNFAIFMDKEATDEHPIGWQMHTYWGDLTQGITFFGPGNDNEASADQRFSIAAANITWNAPVFGKKIPITMGKMYTWIGYELVENIGNPNYTHAATYNNAIPFTHMGISFDVSEFLPSDKWGLKLYYVNGWDSYIDNNEGKSFGAYLSYAPNDDFFISFAAINGPETSTKDKYGAQDGAGFGGKRSSDNVFMYDVVITYALPQIDKLSLGFNWDHGRAKNNVGNSDDPNRGGSQDSSAHWWAMVYYAMYDFTDNQMGALRYEYFDDDDGAKGFGHSMYTITYTHNITIAENLLLRPEVRYNKYNVSSAQEEAGMGLIHGKDGEFTNDDEIVLAFGAEYVF